MILAAEFERRIREHQLPDLAASFLGEEFIRPYYSGLSIANLPATMAGRRLAPGPERQPVHCPGHTGGGAG